ncbi:MAG: zinc-dependent alcohol dehydrogenase [Bacteroidota bacterium]
MKAVQFLGTVPRYLFSKAAGMLTEKAFYGPLSGVVLRDVGEPGLPSPNWVKVKTRYSGICGSDLNLILLHDSPSSSPYVSFPFTFGHENCGTVVDVGASVDDIRVGQRVLVDPVLSCGPREVAEPCEFCKRGDYSLCQNFTKGIVSPGFAIGLCRDTGGGWSERFVAHKSQVIPLDDDISFEDAALVDAFCSALHPVLRNFPEDSDTCLVMGAGVIGISVVAALRALESRARVVVMAKYPFQAELARSFGADAVVCSRESDDYFKHLADVLGGKVLKPMVGKRIVQGGADLVFECVGSSTSIDDALRFTRSGGRMVLVGLAAFPKGVDWTPIWLNEITVRGSFWCGGETYEGEKTTTYRLACALLRERKVSLARLLTHTFRIEDYRQAIEANLHKSASKVVKAAFAFD